MAFVDTKKLKVIERRPGWHGRFFDSPSMSFAHYEFEEGAWIHEHAHDQEEVWHVIEGELEVTIRGVTKRAGPGAAAIVPANAMHKITALTAGKAIVVDYPLRAIAEPAAQSPAPRRKK